jgi:hypothetical protein
MATEKLGQTISQMHQGCEKVLLRLAQLTEQDLAKATPHEWAPTVGEFLAAAAHHNRDHAQQIAAKREALVLEQTPVQRILADVAASQGELDAALTGLSDENLGPVPEGDTWSLGQTLEHVAGTYEWFLSEIERAIED